VNEVNREHGETQFGHVTHPIQVINNCRDRQFMYSESLTC